MPKNSTQRASALLASVSEELLSGDFSQQLQDSTIRVERLLLEMVRPDPVQPRRVLPEQLHFAFHENRLTPTQALRELVQIAQVAARQRGRPFADVLELLPNSEADTDVEEAGSPLSPEETLLRDLVNLAVTIRDDGQVNPLTVLDVSQGVTRLYRIETGERRYWATWLLRDFFSNGGSDGTIPCIVIPSNRASVFRQAKENSARSGLSAIALARQAALLLLSVHGYEIPNYAVSNDFYRQALELDLRGKREFSESILAAMGGIGRSQFSRIKALLRLSDEALELADRHNLDESVLRYVLLLEPSDHVEMVQQIVSLGLTVRQVKDICESNGQSGDQLTNEGNPPSRQAMQLARLMKFRNPLSPEEVASILMVQEGDRRLAQAKVQILKELVMRIEQYLGNQ